MENIFSPDSKVMQALGRLGDIVVLNFIYLLTCVPIFTIGAATTALYTVCFAMGTDRERGTLRTYFRAFRDNFKQATLLWLIILFCGLCAWVDMTFLYQSPGALHYGYVLFAILFALVLLVSAYAFPLMSQFENTKKETLKNALALSLGYLPRSILMVAMNILPFVLLIVFDLMFLYAAFLWVAFYFASVAYFSTMLLRKVFKPYLPEEEELEEEA